MLRYGRNPRAALNALGHRILPVPEPTLEFGAGQILWRLPQGGWGGASDGRRDGHAAAR